MTICLDYVSPHNSLRGLHHLQSRKYLAVSAGLNRLVSVRNSKITLDGRYPLRSRFLTKTARTFLSVERSIGILFIQGTISAGTGLGPVTYALTERHSTIELTRNYAEPTGVAPAIFASTGRRVCCSSSVPFYLCPLLFTYALGQS